jgi:hypothetical protein
MPPDVPPYSQHRLSLALASRRLRSRIQHWTALTIDHHLALDTLVMRRSPKSNTAKRHALNVGGSSLVSTLAIRSSHATSSASSRDPAVRRGSV